MNVSFIKLALQRDKYLIVGLGTALLMLYVVWEMNLWSDMWANLVTEFIGIMITVGWLDRRMKKREEERIKPSVEYVYQNMLFFYGMIHRDLSVLINHPEHDDRQIEIALAGISHYADRIYRYLDKYPEVIEINHRTRLDDFLQSLRLFEEVMSHNIRTGEHGGFRASYDEFKILLNFEEYWEIREELTEFYEKNFPEGQEWIKMIRNAGRKTPIEETESSE